jgi:dipeptidase E
VKLLLTSSGITNDAIQRALETLLPKPIDECKALIITAGMMPFTGGGVYAQAAVAGTSHNPLVERGWESVGLFELTALPSIRREAWTEALANVDAVLVWGGHVGYLTYWMRETGFFEEITKRDDLVYVGVSAGAIAMSTYNCDAESNIPHLPDDSPALARIDEGLGVVPIGLWVHFNNPNPIFADHIASVIEPWAMERSMPTYAIDDQTALSVVDGEVVVISEGEWHCYSGIEA